jgi:hypothetical protein
MKGKAKHNELFEQKVTPIVNSVTPIINSVTPAQEGILNEIHLENEEMKDLNIFLSNFSECFLEHFDISGVYYQDVIEFAVLYNKKNNYDLFVELEDNRAKISEDYIDSTIMEFFSISDIVHQSIEDDILYKDNYYIIEQADGEAIPFVQVVKVFVNDNNDYVVEGIVYDNADGFYGDPYEPQENWTSEQSAEVEIVGKVKAKLKVNNGSEAKQYVLLQYEED